jgi:hypothetical protein
VVVMHRHGPLEDGLYLPTQQLFLVRKSTILLRYFQTLFGSQVGLLIPCPGLDVAILHSLPVCTMSLDFRSAELGPSRQQLRHVAVHAVEPPAAIRQPLVL